ncbi:hypothetical protein ABI59_13705 [Acidobacteria bacterium Mor1]|nr:hypothetical protein ABI59_13705 [Acidobacteria bacterium Mor1]
MNHGPSALENVPLPELSGGALPAEVAEFLADAQRRIGDFRPRRRIAEFQSCDGALIYGTLDAIRQAGLAQGPRFCEWGSGFGVATCCAALLGMQAHGIEIEEELHREARGLAAAHGIEAGLHLGSFKPDGLYEERLPDREPAPLGFAPTDCDLVYAYPWPAEERWVEALFAHYAAPGTLLLTYHGGVTQKLRRRV